jgi:lipopolysaccharide heptosyltransferase II
VLAIRLDNLGDVLMTTPALQALHDSVPGVHVTLLASPAGAALAPHLPAVEDVIAWSAPWVQQPEGDRTAPALLGHAELAMVAELAQRRFDAAVIFTVCTQSALPAALLCRLAGIPLRLAHCRENPYGLLTDWVRDTEVPRQGMRHEVQRQLDLVGHVGWQAHSDRMTLRYEPLHAKQLWRKFEAAGGQPDRPYLVVHPGATAASRRWAPERFGAAAEALVLATGCQVVWCGSDGEKPLIERGRAAMDRPGLSLAGQLSLGELAALIGGAQLTLCNNSAASHIAAALDRPAVVLYALTNPQHTPWRNPARVLNHDVPCRDCLKSSCPEADHPCLAGVTPQAVVEAALALIGPPPAVPVRGQHLPLMVHP